MPLILDAVQVAPPVVQAPAATPASDAPAQSSAPEVDAEGKGENEVQTVEDVVVVSERPAVLNQIDRRIYDIGRDPVAQTSTILEILEKVPSVTVDASGRLRLLGQSGVTILIDGQRPANEQAALRSLTGANIDRIEVMTNPGVQYGPVGTGGIINIITKQRTTPGVTGTIAVTADTYGLANLTVSPSMTRGRWTVNSSWGLALQDLPDRSSLVREVFATPIAPASNTEEFRESQQESGAATASVKIGYRLSDNQRLTGGLDLTRNVQDQDRRATAVVVDTSLADHVELNPARNRLDSSALTAGYSRTGPQEGEELTLVARLDRFVSRSRTTFDSDYGVGSAASLRFMTVERSSYDTQSLKLDFKRPVGEGRILTSGLSWERNGAGVKRDLQVLAGRMDPALRRLDSARRVTAGYATVQFETAGLTFLPGLRLEYQDLDVIGSGITGGDSGVDLYPSLHISRGLGEGRTLKFSYSRRINRADGWALDPTLSYSRPLEAFRGNPELRAQTIDSFEARLDWTRGRWSLNATLYDKEQHDLWSQFSERFDNGLIVSTLINAGDAADRGLELSARGKLGDRFSYVAATNLFASTRQVLDDGVAADRTSFVYSGNAQLEYAAMARDGLEADKIQVSLNYRGPQRDFQTRSDGSFGANLTWRHSMSKRTTAVLLLRNIFNNGGYGWRTETDAYSERNWTESRGVTARLGLTYRLGGIS